MSLNLPECEKMFKMSGNYKCEAQGWSWWCPSWHLPSWSVLIITSAFKKNKYSSFIAVKSSETAWPGGTAGKERVCEAVSLVHCSGVAVWVAHIICLCPHSILPEKKPPEKMKALPLKRVLAEKTCFMMGGKYQISFFHLIAQSLR